MPLLRYLAAMEAEPDTMYQLCRDTGSWGTDSPTKHDYAPNIFMARREQLISIGGYDEDFSGAYGCEDKYLQVCWKRAGFRFARIARWPIDCRDKRGTDTGLDRSGLEHNRELLARKIERKDAVAPGLRFEWEILP